MTEPQTYDLTQIPYEQLRDELIRRSECLVFTARMIINKERAPQGNIVSGFRGWPYEAIGLAFDMAMKIREQATTQARNTTDQGSDWQVCTICDAAVNTRHQEHCINAVYSQFVLPDHCVKKELEG